MIPERSKLLSILEYNPNIFKEITRGIERETLRITPNGSLAKTQHPISFGSALKNKWITTDFAEALMEFITPIDNDINHMLAFLRDIHRHVARQLTKERMWPFSMPCNIMNINDIKLAKYGHSNLGRMKMIYREGLKNRYGSLMQIICGVHYNFSLPVSFWQYWGRITNTQKNWDDKKTISSGYLHLIRNYYRFGWIIPYLFGASPAIFSSFLADNQSTLPFQTNNTGTLWLPYATSLRLSDIGYTNKSKNYLNIIFNSLEEYVSTIKAALHTPVQEYMIMDQKNNDGQRIQLNCNVLQTESELYEPIRPKNSKISNYQTPSDVLLQHGIEYVEVRSLDINPFSEIGINADQIRFLDLFLIWCIVVNDEEMTCQELLCIRENWNKIVLEGRKPKQVINLGEAKVEYRLIDIAEKIFYDLRRIAKLLDKTYNFNTYQKVCDKLLIFFHHPELTYSARILDLIKKYGFHKIGIVWAEKYYRQLSEEGFEILTENDFHIQAHKSLVAQQILEKNDTLDFDSYLMMMGYN